MFSKLRQVLESAAAPRTKADPQAQQRLAVAGLLVEISRADFEEKGIEQQAVSRLLGRYFGLDEPAAADLLRRARAAVDDAVSLREFTVPLHEELSYAQKEQVIGMLWEVALEDRNLDRYEEYLVGKVADLLYVARGDVIRLRYQATERRRAAD